MTKPIWITCKKIRDIPSIEELSRLAEGDQHVVLKISKKNWFFRKNAYINKISKKLPEHSIFDSGCDPKTENITITPVIKRHDILDDEKEILLAIEEYIRTCLSLRDKYLDVVSEKEELFMRPVLDHTIKDEWEFYGHGLEVCFTHQVTGQTVEVPAAGPITLDNIDPYFFGVFVETTPELSKVASLIKDTFHDSARILDIIRERKQ